MRDKITLEMHETIIRLRKEAKMGDHRIANLLGLDHRSIYYDRCKRKTPYREDVTGAAIPILETALAKLRAKPTQPN